MTMKYKGEKGDKTIIKGKLDIPAESEKDDQEWIKENGYMAKRNEFLQKIM